MPVPRNPHIVALETLLEAACDSDVHVTRAPTGSNRHIVLHPARGLEERSSLAPDDTFRSFRFMTHCVGPGWEAADYDATQVRAALSTTILTVAGWKCSPIQHVQDLGIDRDEDMPDTLFLARDMWLYAATTA